MLKNFTFSRILNTAPPLRTSTTKGVNCSNFTDLEAHSELIDLERLEGAHQNKGSLINPPSAAATMLAAHDITARKETQRLGPKPELLSSDMEQDNAAAGVGLRRTGKEEIGCARDTLEFSRQAKLAGSPSQKERFVMAGRMALQQDCVGTWSPQVDYSRPNSGSLSEDSLCAPQEPAAPASATRRNQSQLVIAAAGTPQQCQAARGASSRSRSASSCGPGEAPPPVPASPSCSVLCSIM